MSFIDAQEQETLPIRALSVHRGLQRAGISGLWSLVSLILREPIDGYE